MTSLVTDMGFEALIYESDTLWWLSPHFRYMTGSDANYYTCGLLGDVENLFFLAIRSVTRSLMRLNKVLSRDPSLRRPNMARAGPPRRVSKPSSGPSKTEILAVTLKVVGNPKLLVVDSPFVVFDTSDKFVGE